MSDARNQPVGTKPVFPSLPAIVSAQRRESSTMPDADAIVSAAHNQAARPAPRTPFVRQRWLLGPERANAKCLRSQPACYD